MHSADLLKSAASSSVPPGANTVRFQKSSTSAWNRTALLFAVLSTQVSRELNVRTALILRLWTWVVVHKSPSLLFVPCTPSISHEEVIGVRFCDDCSSLLELKAETTCCLPVMTGCFCGVPGHLHLLSRSRAGVSQRTAMRTASSLFSCSLKESNSDMCDGRR